MNDVRTSQEIAPDKALPPPQCYIRGHQEHRERGKGLGPVPATVVYVVQALEKCLKFTKLKHWRGVSAQNGLKGAPVLDFCYLDNRSWTIDIKRTIVLLSICERDDQVADACVKG